MKRYPTCLGDEAATDPRRIESESQPKPVPNTKHQVRGGIKTYSNWPTIPQCYIDGEFIGGCDLMIELYQSGELQEMVERALAS